MAILLAIALGTTPFGAPLVGWVADHWGARGGRGVGAAAGLTAAMVGWASLRLTAGHQGPAHRISNVG